MKLGTESKKKTITACVLAGIAVILALNWMLNSGPSSQAAAPVASQPVVSPTTPDSNPAKAKREARKRDEKILGPSWKPSLDPSLNLKMLAESESIEYKGRGRNIFDMTTQPVEIPQPIKSPMIGGGPGNTPTPPVHQGPPPPPPINLKFYGFSTRNGQKTVFLAQTPASPDSVFVAHEGDIIARRYKIVRINQTSVEVQDLLSNNKQTINLSPG